MHIDGLRQIAQPPVGFRFRDGPVEQPGHPARWTNQIQQQMNRAGFARAVGAKEAKNFALLYLKAEPPNRRGFLPVPTAAVSFAKIFCANGSHKRAYSFTRRSTAWCK